jgi:hypothetical protein
MREEIRNSIRTAQEEIRRLRRDKKGSWKEFTKYNEGYIHGLKEACALPPVSGNEVAVCEDCGCEKKWIETTICRCDCNG